MKLDPLWIEFEFSMIIQCTYWRPRQSWKSQVTSDHQVLTWMWCCTMYNVQCTMFMVGLTPAETEKSIDLHKVSRSSGLTILSNSNPNLGENRNFEGILNPYKSRQYLQQARSRDIWLSHLRCRHIWTTLDVKASFSSCHNMNINNF